MSRPLLLACLLSLASAPHAFAQPATPPDGGESQADAERQLQSYLAIWSDNAKVTPATVDRFYAPSVDYYGRSFSRAQVLADKLAFIRSYPGRSYREVPGTFAGRCNTGRSLCHVSAEIAWRRTDRRGGTTVGRSRMGFDFVPSDGGRKIARESARTL